MLISTKTNNKASACESARLEALDEYSVFDTPPAPDLDRLVELAARMFGTPVAALSLVGRDRLYPKRDTARRRAASTATARSASTPSRRTDLLSCWMRARTSASPRIRW
jgi:hypothetical protein